MGVAQGHGIAVQLHAGRRPGLLELPEVPVVHGKLRLPHVPRGLRDGDLEAEAAVPRLPHEVQGFQGDPVNVLLVHLPVEVPVPLQSELALPEARAALDVVGRRLAEDVPVDRQREHAAGPVSLLELDGVLGEGANLQHPSLLPSRALLAHGSHCLPGGVVVRVAHQEVRQGLEAHVRGHAVPLLRDLQQYSRLQLARAVPRIP
mmetsp:Transcript_119334/g.371731  ORF Transcript_119334/g.371731 Transcript_119334/m.371731 type:complete len:204 (-) Transcript_119334:661-1272(-)